MENRSSPTWLVADFFTHSYRISGRLNVRHRLLADQLNNPTSDFLQIEDTYISNVEHPADIMASQTSAILYKKNVTTVVTAQQQDGLPREHSYGNYFGAYTRKVFMTVPSFEIEGYLRLSGKLDLRTVLTSGTDDFITILDGSMRFSIRPDISFSGGAILINKRYIGAFCMEEE